MSLDFSLSNTHKSWQQVARDIAQTELAPRAVEIDRAGRFPRDNFLALTKAGLMGLMVPEEFGGQGGDVLTSVLVTEALAEVCGSTAMCYHMHNSSVVPLVALAKDEQIDEFLLPVPNGENILTYAVSEPGSGSRWWHMDGYAEKDSEGFTINTYKSFATSAGEADSYIVLARANPTAKPDVLSVFLVPGNTPGVAVAGCWDALGMRGNRSAPMKFDNCRLRKVHLLGDEGLGFLHLFQYAIPVFLVGMAGVYLGIAQAAFDFAVSHVTKRVHADTGLPLSATETVQRYVSEMKFRLDQTRLIVYRTAALISETLQNEDTEQFLVVSHSTDWLLAIGEAKVIACEAATAVTSTAMQLCGGFGYSRSQPLERFFRDARAGSIMGPNDDSIKLIIGQRLLGQPFPWEKDDVNRSLQA